MSILGLAALLFWAAVPADTFRLGVINERAARPDVALSQYLPLHRYLEQGLAEQGIALAPLVIADDFPDMLARLDAGAVDGIIEGVMPTLHLQRVTGRLAPELVAWRKGQRHYHSVFFVRSDSAIRTLSDLLGRTLAFETPRSTSAYYVPSAALLRRGLPLVRRETEALNPDAVNYVFAGSELNQAYWVQRGEADAGVFNDGDWQHTPASLRRELRVIHRTRPLLRWLFSLRSGLAPQVRSAVLGMMTQVHHNSQGRQALHAAARISRFEPLTAADRADLAYWRPLLMQVVTAQ